MMVSNLARLKSNLRLKTRAEVKSLCPCAFYQFHVKVLLWQIPKWVALDIVVSDLEMEMGAC